MTDPWGAYFASGFWLPEDVMNENFSYSPFLFRDKLVHIVDTDLSHCERYSIIFRLEGFQTTFSLNARDFLAAVERRRPDVVITNMRVGPDSGLDLMRVVKALKPGTPVFVVEDRPEFDGAVQAMKAGATDVFTKATEEERVADAVRTALGSEVRVGPVSGGRRSVEVRGFGQLTPREREVLQLITNGQSNKEAGRLLGISPRTVEVHRARVMEKLGAKNAADLMRIVFTS